MQSGLLEPVPRGTDDARLWMACDLCSLVENRFHVIPDAATLSDAEIASWTKRALAQYERLADPRLESFTGCFFLREGGIRTGTVALSTMTAGMAWLPLSSLYVFPSHRRKGITARALRSIDEAAAAAGFRGIRVATYWTWQRALRVYLKLGMWAYSFKRSIEFVWITGLPRHIIDVAHDTATFSIMTDGKATELLVARRDGEKLLCEETATLKAMDAFEPVRLRAHSTFAVALAVEGWPLLPSPDAINREAGADVGGPAVLAYKIAMFEHLDRRSGFDVRTPRIPGLPYEAIARRMDESR